MIKPNRVICWFAVLISAGLLLPLMAEDWPMWRYDAGHTANSPEVLPEKLALSWERQYSPRVPAWEDPLNQDLMPFDSLFEPVVVGNKMFIPFNDRDKLVALDILNGQELWTFYADGPIRFSPVAWDDKVFCVSDDGYLYCLEADTGIMVWKFRGGLSHRKALGNSRLASAWPARGGPVVRDDTVYFAASIWPFMGTFIYALDAASGKVLWVNDGTGAQYMKQPHSTPSFAGVAPQGTLVATEDILLVPGGRSVPAAFDRATGRFLYYRLDESGKGTGGSTVMASDSAYLVHTRQRGTRTHNLKTGKQIYNFTLNEPVIGDTGYYTGADDSFRLKYLNEKISKLESSKYDETKYRNELADALEGGDTAAIKKASNTWSKAAKQIVKFEKEVVDQQEYNLANASNNVVQFWGFNKVLRWEIKADASGDLIRAGGVLYAAGQSNLTAIALPDEIQKPKIIWTQPLAGKRVKRLLAANGMLFAVTQEGSIMAFGESISPTNHSIIKETFKPALPALALREKAREILRRSKTPDGYALCLGLDDVNFLASLAQESDLHIIGVDQDSAKVELLRKQLDVAGLYGTRVALLAANPGDFGAPPYLANLIVIAGGFGSQAMNSAVLSKVYESVRPYGGKLWILNSKAADANKIRAMNLPKALVEVAEDAIIITREGAIPGSADWTHQYGDVANSVKSDDATVKLPVGLLWFGGNTHMDVLPRHGHGPSPQVASGRLFVEGMDSISARDVYTGRRLWKTIVPGLDTAGVYHDGTHLDDSLTTLYSQRHIPGANSRGANYVVTEDRVYVAISNQCVVLDTASGKILKSISMPPRSGQPGTRREWGFIAVYEDILLGGADFAQFRKRYGSGTLSWPPPAADLSACNGLVAFNRHSGEVLWKTDARHSFINNGIAAGNGRVFCLDRLPKSAEAKLKARGQSTPTTYNIVAIDIRTGNRLWESRTNIFGSWLAYSKKHDLLLQAGASATDRPGDEVGQGMSVLNAKTGAIVWKKPDLKYSGPCIVHNDIVITTPTAYNVSAGAFNLVDGKQYSITNPLTGTLQPWRFYRTYGCNTPIASENLITFRSGAAGFYDLVNHCGVGNLGGFKSGCSANLIAANGVLNAPDYTRTCACPYQNQTSLAFVPMPELEMWTYHSATFNTPEGLHIKRVGLNLGAPGDRFAKDGTLWLEYPMDATVSPRLAVSAEFPGKNINENLFRRYSKVVSDDPYAFVYASGLEGIESLIVAPQTLRAIKAYAPPKTETKPKPATKKTAVLPDQIKSISTLGKNMVYTSLPKKTNTVAKTTKKKKKEPKEPDAFSLVKTLSPAKYTVRLYFAEPEDIKPGQRVFDVFIQDEKVLSDFDIISQTAAPYAGVMKEFKHVDVTQEIEIAFKKASGSRLDPVLSGVELILEP